MTQQNIANLSPPAFRRRIPLLCPWTRRNLVRALTSLLLTLPLSAALVDFHQTSIDDSIVPPYAPLTAPPTDPTIAAVSSTQIGLETSFEYSTVTAPATSGTYRFTHWTNDSYPAETYRDAWGRSLPQISFILLEETTATAHYLPATFDSDTDGIPDWYEIEYFGTLANDEAFDGDGDGITLLDEFTNGSNPLIGESSQEGGISWADSALIQVNLAGYATYSITSLPTGTVDDTDIVPPGTVKTTPNLGSNSTFGYWTLDGVRQEDAWGVAIDQITFTVQTTDINAVAHMFPGDTDTDGIPDAYEQYYFGTLANDENSDTDGDTITLLDEYTNGTHPHIGESSQEGGISWTDSALIEVNLSDFSEYTLTSNPPGTVDENAFVPDGTEITTPNLTSPDFGYWELDGVRQKDAWGVALNQLNFTMAGSNINAVAHFFSGDTDNDGIPDAYEHYYFGSLIHDENSDTDGDTISLLDEYTNGTHPHIGESSQAGGISWADSELVVVNLQPFERLEKVLIAGTLDDFFSPEPDTATGVQIGAETSAAASDWDGDGDTDLFFAHAAGLRVFRNLGSASNSNFEEVFTGFSGLASYISPLDNPIIAGGDFTGDGIGDLVIGGDNNTLRLVTSGGTFTSTGTGLDLPTSSPRSRPALGDIDGDGKLDLLVLLDDGSVRLHLNSGLATPFTNPGTDNILPSLAPDATSITTGDLDGDSLIDILLADDVGRIWEFYQLSGGGFSLQSKVWGGSGVGFANGLTIAAVDLEGDGDTDLIAGLANGAVLAMRNPGIGRPSELTADAGVDSVRLAWDANRQSRLRGYNIYRADSAAGPFANQQPEPQALPTYLDTNLTPGTPYHYYVRGVSYFFTPGNSEPRFVESLPSATVAPTAGAIRLSLRSINGQPGTYVEIPLSLENTLGLSGQNLDISVTYDPALLTPAKQANPAETTVIKTALSASLVLSDNSTTANGTLNITGSSGDIIAGSGNLLLLRFRVSDTATNGQTSALTISSATLWATAGFQAVVDFSGIESFTVSTAYGPGDISGNGILDDDDLTLLKILTKPRSRPVTADEFRAGDLNGDGRLNGRDLVLLKRLLAGLPIN